MYKYSFKGYLASVFAVTIILFGQVSFAQAELISNEQVETQKKEVMLSMIVTLEEHFKFLQMVFIQELEARVAHLQILVDAK